METIIKKRQTEYDALRILAAFLVIVIHVSTAQWELYGPTTYEWNVFNFYDTISRCCVPLFFMISGAFLLKKDIPLKKLYLNKILHLLVIYIVWAVFYALDDIIACGFYGWTGVLSFVIAGKYHLWFIPALIGVYMLIPILRAVIQYEDGKYIKYLLALFMVFGILKNTLLPLQYPIQGDNITAALNRIPVELCGYSGYFLLGYYLDSIRQRIHIKGITAAFGYIITSLAAVIIGSLDAVHRGVPFGIFYGYFTLPVFLNAVFLFIAFQKASPFFSRCSGSKALEKVSSATLGIYVMHPFLLEHLDSRGINLMAGNPIYMVLLLSISVFLVCMLVTFVIQKIPGIKKIV